jgi:AbrB family looped-hinge helix DNA binding protein
MTHSHLKIGAKRQITMPKVVMNIYGLQEGDYLELEITEGGMRLRPVKQRFEPTCFDTETIERLREAVKQIAAGDYREVSSLPEARQNPKADGIQSATIDASKTSEPRQRAMAKGAGQA